MKFKKIKNNNNKVSNFTKKAQMDINSVLNHNNNNQKIIKIMRFLTLKVNLPENIEYIYILF